MISTAPPTPPATRRPPRAAKPPRAISHTAVRRTVFALLATALGIVPLKGLFSDSAWLIDVWVSIVVVLAPAALLRLRRPPGALDIWPGIVLLVPWLTARFLGDTALAGVIPTGETWTRLSTLMSALHETTREEVAPIQTTVPVRLVLCALVGLLAALIDLIAVVGRRGALAGVPLLVVFTVSGAVPREPVAWPYFVIAALGFLILLAIDAGDEQANWGRRVRAPDARRQRGAPPGAPAGAQTGRAARSALAVAAPRIGLVAVIAAVALPLLVPGEPRNLLANAFHGGGAGAGFGGAGGSSGQISPFVNLKGQLNDRNPRKLAEVQMIGTSTVDPYYLRADVLSTYVENGGWRVGSHGERTPVANGEFPITAGGNPDTVSLEARIDVDGMRGRPAVFSYPTQVTGVDSDTGWSSTDQLLLDSSLNEDSSYTVQFEQPAPTVTQLGEASDYIDPAVRSELTLPNNLPDFVRNLVAEETAGKRTQYAKARALSDFFADPENNFVYDLQTESGDSGSDLVDFLQNRRGFCQQYAGALGVMLRAAGVPARVVLGYLNSGPDRNGRFEVSTLDAHAWVEGWFAGVGWVPFDPTPASGLPGGGGTLPWAPRDSEQQASSSAAPSSAPSSSSAAPSSSGAASSSASTAAPVADDRRTSSPTGWYIGGGLVLIVLLVLVPGAIRATRRRQRIAAARRDGDAELLWTELSDTALDLGYVWSDARSPRQVASWLAPDAPAAASSLRTLAEAVEQRRYAGASGGGGDTAPISDALREVTDELRGRRSTRARLRARFWPASLGWTTPFGGSGRREL